MLGLCTISGAVRTKLKKYEIMIKIKKKKRPSILLAEDL